MAEQRTLLIWETEVSHKDGRNELVAKKPLHTMTAAQAAKILKNTPQDVSRLFRAKILTGYKPNAFKERRDGKASNAKIKFDAESVLNYKRAITSEGLY